LTITIAATTMPGMLCGPGLFLKQGPHSRRAVTLSETLVAGIVVGVVLVVISLGMDGIRTELKRHQAVAMLEVLDRALLAYHQKTGHWPADPGPAAGALHPRERSAAASGLDASGDRVIALLDEVRESKVIIRELPEILRVSPGAEEGPETAGPTLVRDPWGRALACLTSASPSPGHRKAVAANQERPVFVSAGADGRFGFTEVSAASDNIRSDELRW